MNLLKKIELKQIEQLKAAATTAIPDFAPGDTLRVNVRMKEGDRERVQAYEGICIARKNNGINSSFTVRKISFGEGVERVFPLYSPKLESIVLVRRGEVRRAKLYYLRGRRGKSARIAERDQSQNEVAEAQAAAPKAAKAEAAPKAEKKVAKA